MITQAGDYVIQRRDGDLMLSIGFRILIAALAFIVAAAILGWLESRFGHIPYAPVALLIGSGLFGLWLVVDTVAMKFVFHANSIERRNAFGTRTINRNEILGYRWITVRSQPLKTELVMKSARSWSLVVPGATDERLTTWIKGLPEIEAMRRREKETALESDPRFGSTVQTRKRTAQALGLWFTTLWVAEIAFGAASYIPERPFWLVLLTTAPPLIWIVSAAALQQRPAPGLFAEATPKLGPGSFPTATMIGISAIVLVVTTMSKHRFVDVAEFVPMTLALGAALFCLCVYVDGVKLYHEVPSRTLLWLASCIACAFGAIAHADVVLDSGPPHNHPVFVTYKRVYHGRSTQYDLWLSPWPLSGRNQVEVPYALYDRVRIGDRLCVITHPGALGLAWYRIEDCPLLTASASN